MYLQHVKAGQTRVRVLFLSVLFFVSSQSSSVFAEEKVNVSLDFVHKTGFTFKVTIRGDSKYILAASFDGEPSGQPQEVNAVGQLCGRWETLAVDVSGRPSIVQIDITKMSYDDLHVTNSTTLLVNSRVIIDYQVETPRLTIDGEAPTGEERAVLDFFFPNRDRFVGIDELIQSPKKLDDGIHWRPGKTEALTESWKQLLPDSEVTYENAHRKASAVSKQNPSSNHDEMSIVSILEVSKSAFKPRGTEKVEFFFRESDFKEVNEWVLKNDRRSPFPHTVNLSWRYSGSPTEEPKYVQTAQFNYDRILVLERVE